MSRWLILLYGAVAHVIFLAYHGKTNSSYQRQVRMLVPFPAVGSNNVAE